jgi:hypothetical protein
MTVRYVGTFLDDPLEVPVELLDYLAEQLAITDPSCVKAYAERDKTRLEHIWEIRKADDWREFSEVEDELAEWIEGRAWTTGDGPKALFDAAVGWLRDRRALLPRVSTLARLVAGRRDAATQRLWETLYALLTDEQMSLLDRLLEVADGDRHSTLDKLRRPPTRVSGPANDRRAGACGGDPGAGVRRGGRLGGAAVTLPGEACAGPVTRRRIPQRWRAEHERRRWPT